MEKHKPHGGLLSTTIRTHNFIAHIINNSSIFATTTTIIDNIIMFLMMMVRMMIFVFDISTYTCIFICTFFLGGEFFLDSFIVVVLQLFCGLLT